VTYTCRMCGQNPCLNPSFCATCDRVEKQHPRRRTPREARTWQLLGDAVSLERMYAAYIDPRNRPTPKAVIDAVVWCVRERGIAALKEPANVEQLSRCAAAAKAEIDRQIEKISR
jgi:hypothetical protein